MKLAARPAALRCAYCRDDLGRAVLTCPTCRTLVHEECELDTCPTLGCGSLVPWELVLTRSGPTVLELVGFGLLVALLAAIGTVAVLLVAWPRRPAGEGVEAPRSTRPAPRPDSAVPALDPWFWWAPGSEILVRTRARVLVESVGLAGCGSSEKRSYWAVDVEETETLLRLQATSDQGVTIRRQTIGESRADFGWRPLERTADGAATLLEREGVPVFVPAGAFLTTRYRRATVNGWEGPFRLYLDGTLAPDGVEETWTDPRVPVPLRRFVTWRVHGAPTELGDCSLESVVVAIRGQAAIR